MLGSMLLLLSFGIRAASAGECLITGPRYQLQSDTVEWQLRARIGQSCIRGIRFKNVASPGIKIISPPRFGDLTLLGPSFSYAVGTDVADKDSFTIEVSGFMIGGSGTSTIHVVVSIIGAPPMPGQAVTDSPNGAAAAAQDVDAPAVISIDNKTPGRRVDW
jgi:hypothetical protein